MLGQVQIVRRKIARTENRDELGIGPKAGVGTQVGGDFLRLILKNHSSRGLDGMIVRQGQIHSLIKTDQGRILSDAYAEQHEERHGCGEGPKIS
jgi:hypothetical protein